jgi:hypothetical protein
MHYFSILFGKELYMFRTDLPSIIRSRNTVFTAIGICHTIYVAVCWRGQDMEHSSILSRIRMFHPDSARKLSANFYDIHHCCVYSEKLLMMYRGTVRNM